MGLNTSPQSRQQVLFPVIPDATRREDGMVQRFPQIHWQCHTGAPRMGTGHTWTAYTITTAKRIRILTAICLVKYSSLNKITSQRSESIMHFCSKFMPLNHAKALVLPESDSTRSDPCHTGAEAAGKGHGQRPGPRAFTSARRAHLFCLLGKPH